MKTSSIFCRTVPSSFRKLCALSAILLALPLYQINPAAAGTLNLAQEPLFSANTSVVYPNLMFILDDSGSMGWDYVPDYVRDWDGNVPSCFDAGSTTNNAITDGRMNCTVGDPPFMSPDFNLIYYNPDFTFSPGWDGNQATPVALPVQSITSTTLDPYGKQKNTQLVGGNTGSTINLTNSYPDRLWCRGNNFAVDDKESSKITITGTTAGGTQFSQLVVDGVNVLTATTTLATTDKGVADAIQAKVGNGYGVVRNNTADGTVWLVRTTAATSVLGQTPTFVRTGASAVALEAFQDSCRLNTDGYVYPDGVYMYPPTSGGSAAGSQNTGVPAATGRYKLGAPYYWRVIPTEYCSDIDLKNCTTWTNNAVNAIVAGVTHDIEKYCKNELRVFADCLAIASPTATHRYPAKCSASNCVAPGTGGSFSFPARVRFCRAPTNVNTDPLNDCQGAYNGVTGHVIPSILGYVIPSAGDVATGSVQITDAIPGTQITAVNVGGVNQLSGTYTVPFGATPESVAAGLNALLLTTTYNKSVSNRVITLAAKTVGSAANGLVVTVSGPASGGTGSPATANITVPSSPAGLANYRLGPLCVGTVSGATCTGTFISNRLDFSADLSVATGPSSQESVAAAIANIINNTPNGGYTAVATGPVVTVTAPGVGNLTSSLGPSAVSSTGAAGTGNIYLPTSPIGSKTYKIASINVASTVAGNPVNRQLVGALNFTADLSLPTGQAFAATQIANAIGNGYTGSATAGRVTVTANVGSPDFDGPLTLTPAAGGDTAAGSITVNSVTNGGNRRYVVSSITAGTRTLASALTISGDLTTATGRNDAAAAIRTAINGADYSATTTNNRVDITSTTVGSDKNGSLALNSTQIAPVPIVLTVGPSSGMTTTTVTGIWMSGCQDTTLNATTSRGILNTTPSSSNVPATLANNIKNAVLPAPWSGVMTMTRSSERVTFTPAATAGSRLHGCTLSVQKSGGNGTFTFAPAASFTAQDALPNSLTGISGGRDAFPPVVTDGVSGGTTRTIFLPGFSTAFSGGTNAVGTIGNVPTDFAGGSGAGVTARTEVGHFKRCDITPTADCYGLGAGNFYRASTRTDCASTSYCTYAEESTNFANWYAYNRTRMQAMKTGAGLAFSGIGSNFRVGFSTIRTDSTADADFIAVKDFTPANKQAWYAKFYDRGTSGGTPLRSSLARTGQMFAHAGPLASADPVQYSCQQNFALLTTDGFWNTDACTAVTQVNASTEIGQQDGAPTVSQLNIDSAKWDGDFSGDTCQAGNSTTASSVGTLADVAYYYAHTDLRTGTLGNCENGVLGVGNDVCANNVNPANPIEPVFQHMSTYTLGLGVSGTLRYQRDYATASSGEFFRIRNKLAKWPRVTAETLTTVDDLWHTAVNGFGTYFSAANPTLLRTSLEDALSAINSDVGSGAAAATSAQALTGSSTNFAYVASYQTGDWFGNLERRLIDNNTAQVATSASWCITDVVGDPNATPPITPCSGQLKAQANNTSNAYGDSRNIFLFDSGSATKLREFKLANLSVAEAAYFEPCATTTPVAPLIQCGLLPPATLAQATPEAMIKYLRGQNTMELGSVTNAFQAFRSRKSAFGDAIGSQPIFVGPPNGIYGDNFYSSYKSSRSSTPETVYIGANDGMLHAFNAATGAERWAYIPGQVLPNMRALADDNYDKAGRHRYFVNASPVVGDVCFDPCTDANDWRTILVSGFGGGGKGFFALDITDPLNPKGLWEFNETNDADMGYSYGNPIITKRQDGKWVVLLSSGYNNTSGTGTGEGVLFVIRPDTGAVLTRISNNSGTTANPSGLAKIESYIPDAVRDNTTLDVYGGDLDGNVWRFRLKQGDESVVKVAAFADTSGNPQPITTKPVLTTLDDSAQTRYVIVGTGLLIQAVDMTNFQPQTIYAFGEKYDTLCAADSRSPANCANAPKGQVIDAAGTRGSASVVPSTRATLGNCDLASASTPPLQTTCSTGGREQMEGLAMRIDGTLSSGASFRVFDGSIAPTDSPVFAGCYVNLPDSGERLNVDPVIVQGKVVAVTNVPEATACTTGGRSWLNQFDYKTCRPDVSYALGSALAVGLTTVRTATGNVIPLVTMANNPTPKTGEKVESPSLRFQGNRVGWRLLDE